MYEAVTKLNAALSKWVLPRNVAAQRQKCEVPSELGFGSLGYKAAHGAQALGRKWAKCKPRRAEGRTSQQTRTPVSLDKILPAIAGQQKPVKYLFLKDLGRILDKSMGLSDY